MFRNNNLAITQQINILARNSVWYVLLGDSPWGQNWGYLQGHRQNEILNGFYHKTQLFCGLRPKIGIPCVELFVAGDFVTRNQQNANRDDTNRIPGHRASFPAVEFNLCSIIFLLPLLIFLWKTASHSLLVSLVTNDFQFFICGFLMWNKICLLLYCIDKG